MQWGARDAHPPGEKVDGVGPDRGPDLFGNGVANAFKLPLRQKPSQEGILVEQRLAFFVKLFSQVLHGAATFGLSQLKAQLQLYMIRMAHSLGGQSIACTINQSSGDAWVGTNDIPTCNVSRYL
jgi:hypothetical protein